MQTMLRALSAGSCTATLGEITNDYAKQHVKMSFKIATVTGDAAYTEFVGHEVTRDYLRSLVKRRSSRVDCHRPAPHKGRQESPADHLLATRLPVPTSTQEHAIRNAITEAVTVQAAGMGLNHAPQRDCIG
ncbi:MAG: hypothetical protein MZV65_31220 [Chromatiales bacterium]|nr:hypothetical protein [Chromatiales bacterium]